MADTKIGIDVQASTGAAVTQLGALGEETRKLTDAADAAGKGQKGLGREIAATRSLQIEASEAVRRAKSAQEEHNLTVGAFGAKSAQAKASQEALTKAQKESAQAADKAAKSLEATAKAATDLAKAEGDQLSPATIRANKTLQDMGKSAERAAQDMRKAELAGKQQSKGFDLMGMAGGKLMGILGPAALGGSLVALAGWLGDASAKTLQYETALANLPFALKGAQEATHGLMSESALAVSASQAVALGVVKTEAEFNQLAADAAKIALKLGTSTDAMLGDLTTALGRGSAMILDNAGIILKVSDANEAYAKSIGKAVGELSELEKKQAFQIAAMEAIRKSADETKVAYDSNSAAVQKFKIGAGDAWDSFERASVNAFGAYLDGVPKMIRAQEELQHQMDLVTQEAMRAEGWSEPFKEMIARAGEAALEIDGMRNIYSHFVNVLNDPTALEKGNKILAQEAAKAALLSEEAKHAERLQRAMERITKSNESILDAQAERELFVGPMPAPKKEKKSGGRKKKEDKDLELVKKTEFRHDESDAVAEMFAKDLELQDAAMVKSFERKQSITDQEIELAEARGLATESMIDRKMAQEMAYARWQEKNARDDKSREEALTRIEGLEHKKRLAAATKAQKAEEALAAQKAAMFEKINGHVVGLGESVVSAIWAQAEGEKGAIAAGVAAYAKGISQKMALKALEETALGVAALAGIYTAALAPPHFAAAGIAAAAAVAAGGVAVGFGALAKSQQGGGSAPKAPSSSSGSGTSPRSGSSDEGGDDDGIPTSYVERSNFNKRNQATSPRKEGGGNVTNINVNNPQFLGATQTQVGVSLKRMMDNVTSSKGKTR